MASFTASSSTVGLINDDRMSSRGQSFRNVRKETAMPSTLFGQPLETPVQEPEPVQESTTVSPATEQKSDVQALIDEQQTTRVREVLTRRLGMLFNSFSSGDNRTMYTRPDGRAVSVRAFIMSLSTRVVDRALNPQSRAKTHTKIVDGVVQTGQLDPFKYVNRTKDQKNILTVNVSSGKVSGLQLPSWSVRAQKGRYVPRHTIVEHAGYVSSELWSYAMELVNGLTAYYNVSDMKGFGEHIYKVQIGRVRVRCKMGDNLITRILWAAGQLATSEHRSKGDNGSSKAKARMTVQMPEDYDTNEHMEVIKTFDQVDIQQAVREMYPLTKCPGVLESTSDKKARLKHNDAQLAKRIKAVELFSAIKDASIGQVSEIQLSRSELLFMKVLNRSVLTGRVGAGQMVRVDEMHKVTDDMCQRVVDLISHPECTLDWVKAQRDSLMRYCMFVPNGQKFRSVFANIMRRKDVQEFMAYAADHFGVDGMPLKRGASYDGVPTSSNPETVKMTSLMAERAPLGGTSDTSTFEDCKRVKMTVHNIICEPRDMVLDDWGTDHLDNWEDKFPEQAASFRAEPRLERKIISQTVVRVGTRYTYNPALQGILAQCREQLAYKKWLSDNRPE
jgi:hypothetical protein